MKHFAVIAVILACGLIVPPPEAVAGSRLCPPGGAVGMTLRGGLRVTDGNYCLLDHVTVNGTVVVEAGGVVDLENSTVHGGIRVLRGGEIEIGISRFFTKPSFSTVDGGLRLDHPVDWDIEDAELRGGVWIEGHVHAEPTFCGNTVRGDMHVANVSIPAPGETFFGDPETDEGIFGGSCEGNRFYGSLSVIHSRAAGFQGKGNGLEVEGNVIAGSVLLRDSWLQLNGNRIGGSLICSHATLVPGEFDSDPSGNLVGGTNTC
jgi:hypothetical protein